MTRNEFGELGFEKDIKMGKLISESSTSKIVGEQRNFINKITYTCYIYMVCMYVYNFH